MTFLLLISSCCQEKAQGCYSEASVLSFFFQVYIIYLFWLNEDLVCYASLSYSTRNQHDCPKVCFRAGSCVPFVLLCIFNVINTRLTCTEIQSVFNVGCLSHIPKTACFWRLWNKYQFTSVTFCQRNVTWNLSRYFSFSFRLSYKILLLKCKGQRFLTAITGFSS